MSSKQGKKSQKTTESVPDKKVTDPVPDKKVTDPAPDKKVVKKTKAPKEVVPVVVPLQNKEVPLVSNESVLSTGFTNVLDNLSELNGILSRVKNEIRGLEKMVNKEMKQLDRINAKKNKNKGNRAPSGFVKPTKISDELATFLGKDKGSMMARTDVTKEMTAYIRAHSLQDKENGRKILPDTKLKKLLKVSDTDELTYFNLQRYMSPHFEKAAPKV